MALPRSHAGIRLRTEVKPARFAIFCAADSRRAPTRVHQVARVLLARRLDSALIEKMGAALRYRRLRGKGPAMHDRANCAAFTIILGQAPRSRKSATPALQARLTSGLTCAFSARVRGQLIPGTMPQATVKKRFGAKQKRGQCTVQTMTCNRAVSRP